MRPTQARTNHLGYDAGSSRRVPDGLIARAATTERLESGNPNVLTRFALTLFRILCFVLGAVKAAALKAAAAVFATSTVAEAQEKARHAPTFQIQVRVDGATVMLDAGSAWTAADVKAALHAKTGRSSSGYYLVAGGGKPLNDGAATTLAALGVGPGDQLELRGRLRGGMPWWCCGASSVEPAGPAPPLTAKQLAKKKKEAEVIAKQLAKTSYWDEVGSDKPNASALKAALADTVLVDAAWLARLAKKRGVLPRCQDLPPGARVTLEEMEMWTDEYTVGVLVISYPWLDADHPDKDGLQLRAISHVLKIFDKEAKSKYGAGCKVGVFLDYVSMPQRSRGSAEDDRTPEELAIFGRALKGINLWYGNPKTHVLLVDTELPAGAHTNTQPYKGRGWCVMEYNASGLVKDDTALISLKGLTGEEGDLNQVRTNGKAAREPPVAPAPFASTLEAGVASGATKFTNKGDVGLVGKIYGWAFDAEMAAAVALEYVGLGWDDAQMLTLCAVLRAAHAGGGLRKLETLFLNSNKMGDGAAAALAALLEEGAMPNLVGLFLRDNQISDAGVAALASALQGGALPSCTTINLGGNQISDAGVAALASALQGGALPSCTYIGLGDNQISDAGVAALASALRGGALPSCTLFGLDDNPGSGAPVDEAFASPERAAALARRQAE